MKSKSVVYGSDLPRDAMHSAVLVIVNLSVCPSARLSVTLVDGVHVVQPAIMISYRVAATQF